MSVPPAWEHIHAIQIARPFCGMVALCDKFRDTVNEVRAVGVTRDEARSLVRLVVGWPRLSEDPKPSERTDQESLDADLEARLQGYLHDLGENAYAAFNTMTDSPAHPPVSNRFRRDRPNLERRAGAWLRAFNEIVSRPGFTIPRHLKELAVASSLTAWVSGKPSRRWPSSNTTNCGTTVSLSSSASVQPLVGIRGHRPHPAAPPQAARVRLFQAARPAHHRPLAEVG